MIHKLKVRFNEYKKTTAYASFIGVAPWMILLVLLILVV